MPISQNLITTIPTLCVIREIFSDKKLLIFLLLTVTVSLFCIVNIVFQQRTLRQTGDGDIGVVLLISTAACKLVAFAICVIASMGANVSDTSYFNTNVVTWVLFTFSVLFLASSASRKDIDDFVKKKDHRPFPFSMRNPGLYISILLVTAFLPPLIYPKIFALQ
jgi:hypothetical protein